ncbi:TonB-dependent receptor [Hyphomicrobium sp.]|uniref:TonB-dependent receptor n=1 Tax=Hyphomicrobium sp. TaxID=82 RepID=UPI002C56E229|nr:TonB-dependent receptor [Hyphomicrobium sp.]HRN86982.1 TonB-dependent receptor [Hyphomicrobium sp.]HRQ26664.1 TonB-dependent receptor [Hyphomicrobium sp.]
MTLFRMSALFALSVSVAALPQSLSAQELSLDESESTVVLPGIDVEQGGAPARKAGQARNPQRQSGPSASAVASDELVVTPGGRPEARGKVAGTVQVIDRGTIERSTSQSVTELLRENAVGFFSEWTPGQTSINIRGAATDGQGKDFRSQVLVLVNGRRAGTANLSKLSLADVDRIEVVRGPASVIYGSQNLGGVINIIMKTGRSAPGTLVEGRVGSWDLHEGKVQHGGTSGSVDYYAGVSGGARDDYHSGKGGTRMENTDWERRGATGSLGYQINPNHRLEFNIRTDGIYDVGFRGSGANTISKDDRSNKSADAAYYGRTADGVFNWFLHGYIVEDVDNFKWASPAPPANTSVDHNRRELDIVGVRVQPRVRPWEGHELLVGWDWEESTLRSDRFRLGLGGAPMVQAPPQDNNQTDRVQGFYFEDSQTFFNDVLGLRGGMRYTKGTTSFDYTPHYPNQVNTSQDYDALTYSFGGTLAIGEGIVLRAGTSTGFRAPTATELAAQVTNLNGSLAFGNPNLDPETNEQIEVGANISGWLGTIDLALFQNVISDRIITRARPGAVPDTSDYINNPSDIEVRGIEVGFDANLMRAIGAAQTDWRWNLFSNGYYNFHMIDKGAPATANTDKVQRMYEYELSIGTRFGQSGPGVRDWSLQAVGLLRGPMWYDTEEWLIPSAEPDRNFVHRKGPFWVWNIRGDIELTEGLKLFAGINNLFDVNEHPIFIALDTQPCIALPARQNGGCGTSMPGREYIAGLQWRW